MTPTPVLVTPRTLMEVLGPVDAQLMLDYYLDNRAYLQPWEPQRNEEFFSLSHWQQVLTENQVLWESGAGLKFSALSPDRSEVIATCNFSNIVRGVFQACHLGYSIAEKYQGQGIMTEVLRAGIDHVFEDMGLHRIMANYQPENTRSAALLERLGFQQEGIAHSYLKIGGQWRDHVLTSLINPAHA